MGEKLCLTENKGRDYFSMSSPQLNFVGKRGRRAELTVVPPKGPVDIWYLATEVTVHTF